MKLGTKSLLFGCHQCVIHPCIVFEAWRRINGFPWSLPIIASFFLHDLGYVSCGDIDGKEGKLHPFLGAKLMTLLFDRICNYCDSYYGSPCGCSQSSTKWYLFCLYHSRSFAKANNAEPSKLCLADKLAFLITPKWLELFLARLSGEIYEFMERSGCKTPDEWYEYAYQESCNWIIEQTSATHLASYLK